MKSQRDSIVQIHCGIPPSRRHLESESPAASGIPLEEKPPRGLTTIQQEFVQMILFVEGILEGRASAARFDLQKRKTGCPSGRRR